MLSACTWILHKPYYSCILQGAEFTRHCPLHSDFPIELHQSPTCSVQQPHQPVHGYHYDVLPNVIVTSKWPTGSFYRLLGGGGGGGEGGGAVETPRFLSLNSITALFLSFTSVHISNFPRPLKIKFRMP